MKTINCNNNLLSEVKSFKLKINDDKTINHEIYIVDFCQNTDMQQESCKACYGYIILEVKEFINNLNKVEKIKKYYRDKFIINEDNRVINILEATEFYNKIKKDIEIETTEYKKENISFGLRGYDRPQNYKTACLQCKNKMCRDGKEKYIDTYDIKSKNYCSKQKQTVYYIY